jgi:hypothetical protein
MTTVISNGSVWRRLRGLIGAPIAVPATATITLLLEEIVFPSLGRKERRPLGASGLQDDVGRLLVGPQPPPGVG